MARIDEIAPNVFRISTLLSGQYNHFFIRDNEPLLFHAGYKAMFPELREAVTRLRDPARIRSLAARGRSGTNDIQDPTRPFGEARVRARASFPPKIPFQFLAVRPHPFSSGLPSKARLRI